MAKHERPRARCSSSARGGVFNRAILNEPLPVLGQRRLLGVTIGIAEQWQRGHAFLGSSCVCRLQGKGSGFRNVRRHWVESRGQCNVDGSVLKATG
jgi:hypothetical protein